jgi:hypothetical protein
MDYGLTYYQDAELNPLTYVNADYGGCQDTCRLTSGYIFTMAGGVVTWSSKRQAMVALSMVEAEYVAMSWCAQQMVWMQTWLDEVEITHTMLGVIKGNSWGAIALANSDGHGCPVGNFNVTCTHQKPVPQQWVRVSRLNGNGFTQDPRE